MNGCHVTECIQTSKQERLKTFFLKVRVREGCPSPCLLVVYYCTYTCSTHIYIYLSLSDTHTRTKHFILYKKRIFIFCAGFNHSLRSTDNIWICIHCAHILEHTTNICIWRYALIYGQQTSTENIERCDKPKDKPVAIKRIGAISTNTKTLYELCFLGSLSRKTTERSALSL